MRSNFNSWSVVVLLMFGMVVLGLGDRAVLIAADDALQTDEKQTDDKQADEKQADDDKKSDSKKEEDDPELTAEEYFQQAMLAMRGGEIDEAIEFMAKAHKADPKEQQYALYLISGLTRKATVMSQDDRKSANEIYFRAAEEARKLLKLDDEELEPGAKGFLGMVIYNEACSHAIAGETEKALASLQVALEAGFYDFETIESDKELDELRKDEKFNKLLETHKKLYLEQLVKETKTEIAEHESYDFEFDLKDVDGNQVTSGDFKTKILIADFWGTWCGPCIAEVPHFVRLKKEYGEKGLEIVGINYEGGDDEEEAITQIKETMKDLKINYACVIGDEQTKDQVPDFRGYPTTLFLDGNGKVRLTLVGGQSYEKLETIVKILLAEKESK